MDNSHNFAYTSKEQIDVKKSNVKFDDENILLYRYPNYYEHNNNSNNNREEQEQEQEQEPGSREEEDVEADSSEDTEEEDTSDEPNVEDDVEDEGEDEGDVEIHASHPTEGNQSNAFTLEPNSPPHQSTQGNRESIQTHTVPAAQPETTRPRDPPELRRTTERGIQSMMSSFDSQREPLVHVGVQAESPVAVIEKSDKYSHTNNLPTTSSSVQTEDTEPPANNRYDDGFVPTYSRRPMGFVDRGYSTRGSVLRGRSARGDVEHDVRADDENEFRYTTNSMDRRRHFPSKSSNFMNDNIHEARNTIYSRNGVDNVNRQASNDKLSESDYELDISGSIYSEHRPRVPRSSLSYNPSAFDAEIPKYTTVSRTSPSPPRRTYERVPPVRRADSRRDVSNASLDLSGMSSEVIFSIVYILSYN